jgi:sulfotransferase famil protein
MSDLEIVNSRKNPVILDRERQFIFFPNSKVCQRSIVLGPLKDRVVIQKRNPEFWTQQMQRLDTAQFEKSFKFTIVRNPYDRTISAFRYLQGGGIIPKRYDFPTYCKEVLADLGTAADPHFNEQSNGLFKEKRLLVDFVGRFESLQEDWDFIASKINASSKFIHANKSRRKADYTAYYDKESQEIVSNLYRSDFENFGYVFDDQKHATDHGTTFVNRIRAWFKNRSF